MPPNGLQVAPVADNECFVSNIIRLYTETCAWTLAYHSDERVVVFEAEVFNPL